MIRFDSAGTELDLRPGATATVQGQSLVLPEGKEGGLTLDQRAMVSCSPTSFSADLTVQTLATAVSSKFTVVSKLVH